MDLYNNEEVIGNRSGDYSAMMFATRAQEIVEDHARSTPDKVIAVTM